MALFSHLLKYAEDKLITTPVEMPDSAVHDTIKRGVPVLSIDCALDTTITYLCRPADIAAVWTLG